MENKLNKEQITTYTEIKDILAEIDSLEKKLEELDQNNGNKEEKYYISDKLNKLKHKLEKGINLDLNFDVFKDSIILFLKNLGFLNNDILEKLSNARFVVTEVKFLTNAKMYNVSNNVYIDSSYIEFDNNGYPIGIKKENIEEFNHALIHELLHLISYVDYKPLTGEALSEGYTDLSTLMITKNPNIISKHYLPFLKIAYLVTSLFYWK